MPAPRRKTYAFTDPLGSSDPAGTRWRIRRALALMYGGAAPSLFLAVLTDGGPLSQRLATGTAMAVTAAFAVLMLAWRRVPDLVLLAGFPLAALTVASIAVLDPPLALTPMFYVWPLMIAAYFLQQRDILITYCTVCASFGAVSLGPTTTGPASCSGPPWRSWAASWCSSSASSAAGWTSSSVACARCRARTR